MELFKYPVQKHKFKESSFFPPPKSENEDVNSEISDSETIYEEDDSITNENPVEEEAYFPPSLITYNHNGEQYIVDTDPFLQKNFENVNPEINYSMNLCIYKCVQNGSTPYLLYLMVHDTESETLVFPHYKTSVGGGSDEPMEETEDRVLEDFKKRLFDLFPPDVYNDSEDATDIYTEDLFRGFYLEENDISFVYDATRVNVPLASDKPYYWVSPYEMFVSKRINHLNVDETLIRTISSSLNGVIDKRFYHLTRLSDNSLVKDPYVLFLCKPVDSMFSGVAIENVSEPLSDQNTENLLFPRIQHPLLGHYTFFSSLPASDGLSRYAVFVDTEGLNPLYVEKDDSAILDHLYSPENTTRYSAVTFFYNSVQQVWCIKSPYYFSLLP